MAAVKKDDKGKKGSAVAKKPGKQLHKLYSITGESIQRKNRTCPKCGPGMFLASHSNRFVCGKCKYVEMSSRGK